MLGKGGDRVKHKEDDRGEEEEERCVMELSAADA